MKSKSLWLFLASLMVLGFTAFFVVMIGMMFFENKNDNLEGRGDLAYLEVKGAIFSSDETVKQLGEIEKNPYLKGLILRIDSPGGAVGPSQEIYQAVQRVQKNKKVIVSMGSVAASGGYYIAVAADRIIANPGTITGSIGVLMDYTNVEDLLKFLKVHAEVLTAGKLKDVGSPLKPMTEEDRAFLHSLLDNMHQQFKEAVKTGRHFDTAKIDELADGRVFTGEQALKLGLVDELGNQQTAIEVAKKLLDLPKDPVILYPRQKKAKLLDLLTEGDLESKVLKLVYSLREGKALYLSKGMML